MTGAYSRKERDIKQIAERLLKSRLIMTLNFWIRMKWSSKSRVPIDYIIQKLQERLFLYQLPAVHRSFT